MAFRWRMGLGILLLAGTAAAQDAGTLKSDKEKQSYALGASYAKSIQKQSIELDQALFNQGLKDVLSGGKTLLSDQEIRAVVAALSAQLKGKGTAAQVEKSKANAGEGASFLAENKTKEGVVSLESGLQYRILRTGDGKKPTAGDTVVCHYRGTFIDGTEFASSYKNNRPATLSLNRAIKGWNEALQLMPVGSKWQLFVPSNLAYAERGARGLIGPNATLIFEVELLSIKEPAAAASATGQGDPIKTDSAVQKQHPVTSAVPSVSLSGIQMSFKLDPRLSGPTYGGERWISPSTFVGAAAQDTVEVRVQGTDARGQRIRISPTWIADNPDLVMVTPSEGDQVRITVKGSGESKVQVTADGISRELAIKAEYKGKIAQVQITQLPAAQPSPAATAPQPASSNRDLP